MSWFWESYHEFAEWVQPIELNRPRYFKDLQHETRYEIIAALVDSVEEFSRALSQLKEMGYSNDPPAENEKQLGDARQLIWALAREGEHMMLLQKRLAKSRRAGPFLGEKDLDEHWERYSITKRIYYELRKLVLAAEKFLEGFYDFSSGDEEFLIRGLDLPNGLRPDFYLARNLFSVGFGEVGVLIAGRGIEGVLREVARRKALVMRHKNTQQGLPGAEADFHDLIELFYRARWKKDHSRLIDKRTRDLLHFLRDIRNSTAHPHQLSGDHEGNWEELATITVIQANTIWIKATRKGARLAQKIIEKDW
jgi:hypothetical protein